MQHGRVAGKRATGEPCRVDAGGGACRFEQRRDGGGDDGRLHVTPNILSGGSLNARQHVVAMPDLGIEAAGLGCQRAGFQVNQLDLHGGGANVDGKGGVAPARFRG